MAVTWMPDEITFGQKYDPAMLITDETEARDYLESCILHCMRVRPCGREEAERVERFNIGYWAGYYDVATQERVETVFHCAHPIFGPVAESKVKTPQDALLLGMEYMRHAGKQPR